MGEQWRLIACVPREPAGLAERTEEALRNNPIRGVVHEWELVQFLTSKGIGGLDYARRLPAFHRLIVSDLDVYSAIARLLQHFYSPEPPSPGFLQLVEPDRRLRVASGPSIAIGGKLDLTKGKHTAYLTSFGITDAAGNRTTGGLEGSGVTVVVIDSGAKPGALKDDVNDFKDLISDPPAASAVDNLGHGTAMAQLVSSVAPKARVCAVRVFDTGGPELSDAYAGIVAALSEFDPDVVSLSLGFPDLGSPCTICGSHAANRSAVFRYLFDSTEKLAQAGGNPDPIFVAATGNDHPNTDVYFPAAFANSSVLAIGAIRDSKSRSSFSNYGKNPGPFAVSSGGDWDYPHNKADEWVGEGKDAAGNPTYCMGTSPAAAYAAGVMALYREQIPRRTPGSAIGGAADVVDTACTRCLTDLSPTYSTNEHGSGRLVFAQLSNDSSGSNNVDSGAATASEIVKWPDHLGFKSRGGRLFPTDQ